MAKLIQDLPTPAVIVDVQIAERNIARMVDYCRRHALRLRPHTKTHKTAYFAERQLNCGAAGLTFAKSGELEALSKPGQDVLLAYPVWGDEALGRLVNAARDRTVRMALDHIDTAAPISVRAHEQGVTIGILVHLDVGMGRCGLQTADEVVTLAKQIVDAPGLRFDGLLAYPGHIWGTTEQRASGLAQVSKKLGLTVEALTKSGLEAGIVSGGSTPTAYQSHLIPEYTEIRPGTFIFYDMNSVHGGVAMLEDCAARIQVSVVSTAVPNQIVVDSGNKTLTSDLCIPNLESGHGHVIERPQAKIKALSEEHGQIDVSKVEGRPFKIGERLTIIPNHVCPCVNLHDALYLVEGERVIERIPVTARGRIN